MCHISKLSVFRQLAWLLQQMIYFIVAHWNKKGTYREELLLNTQFIILFLPVAPFMSLFLLLCLLVLSRELLSRLSRREVRFNFLGCCNFVSVIRDHVVKLFWCNTSDVSCVVIITDKTFPLVFYVFLLLWKSPIYHSIVRRLEFHNGHPPGIIRQPFNYRHGYVNSHYPPVVNIPIF